MSEAPDDEVVYDLSDWSPAQRIELEQLLAAEGLSGRWDAEGTGQLLVPEGGADLVEELIDEVDHPDALEPDDGDDDGGGEVLSRLYVASDVLLGAPSHLAAIEEAREAAASTARMGPPYGLDAVTWDQLRRRSAALVDALALGDEERVSAAAGALREVVRPLV